MRGRGRGREGGRRGGSVFRGRSSGTNHHHNDEVDPARLAQSVAFVDVDTVTRQFVPGITEVMAVAKPFASSKVYEAIGETHVPQCEGQNTAQNLQAALALMYRNASAVLWNSQLIEAKANASAHESKVHQRRPTFLSVPIWMAQNVAVVGTLELLIHTVDPILRNQTWMTREGGGAGFITVSDIDRLVKQQQAQQALNNVFGQGNDDDDDDNDANEEKKDVDDNASSADLNKAKLLLSLTPLEAANYIIHGGSSSALDPGCNATACPYVNQTLFGFKRHYFLYAGVDAPTEQKVDLNVCALFSLPNALTILLRRSEAHSVVCSAAGRDIRTAVDLINAVYGGPLPPSEDKARQAHNQRTLAIANDDAGDCVEATHVLQEALKELKQEQVTYVSFADKVRREAGKGLVPQFRPFTTLVRDLYEDIRLTQLDPAKLIRAFLPLTAASSSTTKASSQGIELKEHLFAQRDFFKDTMVDPLVARLPEIHVSEEANEQFRRARRMLFPTALAVLGRSYPEPMPECFDVLRELQPLTSHGVNPVMTPMVALETCEMTPSDNLLMRLCQVMRENNLDANSASWAVTCMQLLLSTSLVKGQARENFVLSGGHAAGKSYTLKELAKLLFGADLMVEVRTATSQKSGQNTIYPQVNDEAESGVVSIWELLKRRGMFGVYDTSNETRDRKATMSQQSVTYSKNDYKDPVTGQSRNKKQHTIFFANTIGTTNFPALLGTDQAVTSRERDANPLSSLGTTESHITWLPDAYDKAQKLKTWSDLRRLNFVCFFGFHCRAMGLFQPLKSDTGLMIGHSVVSSVTHTSENAFGSLFSSASNNTTNRSDMESAFMNRLRDNLEGTQVRSLMFQLAEMVPEADETLNYYKRRRLLDQIVDLLHMGLPAVAYTRNDSVSLLTQRDTRYIRALNETLEYQSAMLSVFNNNAAGASYTRGSFFDRMQVLEDAHCDQTVENVLKGLQSCSWLDVRIIDGALAILALYCQISAQELSPILPDAKGIVTFRNFFSPIMESKSSSSASNPNGDKGNDGMSRDTRIFYFFRRLNQVFARPIWETKAANEMLMLLMFVRVVGSNQSLLDYRDFDDKNDNPDLHIDVRVMLYGHFASMINNKISVLSRPIESLGFHSTLENRGTFRCSPTVYSLEPRCPSPDSLPPNSMWRQRVTREILFRENRSWLQNRIAEETPLQRRSVSVPILSSSSSNADALPLASPKRALSETTSTLIDDDEDNDADETKGPTDDMLLEDCMEHLETQVRAIELHSEDNSTSKKPRSSSSAAVFVANGNNFQTLRLQPTEEIPAVAQNLLNLIEQAQNPRACYVFQRLIRVSHVPLTVHTDEQESPEYKLAGVWRAAFHQIEFSPSQRTHFTRRLNDLLELLRSNANDKIAEINIRTKTLAARISRLASRYSASQPLFMGLSSDSNEIQWLNVEHLGRPFDHFPPVKAHSVWRKVILERTRYAHYTLTNSQLIYERHGILLDADLREREREQRFRRLYPNMQHERLWCSSENLRTNQRFMARIMHLVKLLEPIFKFHAAIVCDESDDEALCFHGTPLLDAREGKHIRRVFTHAPYQDSAHFLADARSSEQEAAASIYVVTYKALLYEALVLFFEYMRWKASLQGMLCVTVDADLCHYTAESLGLVYCTRIVDTLASIVASPNLLDDETVPTVNSAVTRWIDEVIFEYKSQRDEAVDRFTLNQQAVSQLPFSLADLRRSVFVPAFEDFPLNHEVIVQRFAPYTDFVPLVSNAVPHNQDTPSQLEGDDHDETEEQREDMVLI